MTYKQIPFTLEEWGKDPEGRKIKHNEDGSIAAFAGNFPGRGVFSFVVVWESGRIDAYSPNTSELRLLIPVKTVRKWRNLYKDFAGNLYNSKEEAEHGRFAGSFAILSAEFDEEGNYIKGSVKVEEV